MIHGYKSTGVSNGEAQNFVPGKTQTPEVWILDTALETRVRSIRLATGWKSLES